MKEKQVDFKKPECPSCGSKQVLTRKDHTRWCRVCGTEWPMKKEELTKAKK